jgi:hypothetical protein
MITTATTAKMTHNQTFIPLFGTTSISAIVLRLVEFQRAERLQSINATDSTQSLCILSGTVAPVCCVVLPQPDRRKVIVVVAPDASPSR